MTYLYLIRSGDHVKIGVANDLDKRLKGIATGNPFPVTVISYFQADDAARIEDLLHEHFAPKRHKLEWFNLDENDIKVAETICVHNGAVKMPAFEPRKKKPSKYQDDPDVHLQILQTVIHKYQVAGGETRVQNIVVAGNPGTVILLNGVFFCPSCRNLYRATECPKCPPVQQPAP